MNLSKAQIKQLQRALKAKGFNPGPIDGDKGPKTNAAIVGRKLSRPAVGTVSQNEA